LIIPAPEYYSFNFEKPLYYSDMKYYKKQDFEYVPSIMIHLAENVLKM
jgi:hypothetical protein